MGGEVEIKTRSRNGALPVMAGLVPAIYVKPGASAESVLRAVATAHSRPALRLDDVDARDKPGHDGAGLKPA